MPIIQDFLEILKRIVPATLAESWDNVGLLAGEPGQPVHRVLLALDPTLPLVEQAIREQYDLILTHHPVIFHPLKNLRTDTPTGRFLSCAVSNHIGVIACHTNYDSAPQGVSDCLAELLGLQEIRPLQPSTSGCPETCGLGRIGQLQPPLDAQTFVDRLTTAINPSWILEAGPRPQWVRTAAVCGGSCSDFAELAKGSGADVFLTAEVKHSVARWAEDAGFWIVDGGHFGTENPAIAPLCQRLRQEMAQREWNIILDVARQEPPLRLVAGSI